MTMILALLGVKALYLLFIWLASAIVGLVAVGPARATASVPAWPAGLLLTVVGIVIWLVI